MGASCIGDDRADQLGVGYVYNLSKRTALYSTLAVINNKGNARFLAASAPAGVGGGTSRGFEIGMRQEF